METAYQEVLRHYQKEEVKREIASYATGRWVGLHCEETDSKGRRRIIRYTAKGRPLTLSKPSDVEYVFKAWRRLRPRTFYATALMYEGLTTDSYVGLSNATACTPTWDVDNEADKWKATIEAAIAIVNLLDKVGVSKSVYALWSGRGIHVRVNQEAVSRELRSRVPPLDLAFALVEYVRSRLTPLIADISARFCASGLTVENRMDPQRMFTCPLSLHRELPVVCVAMSPEELKDFDPSWTRIEGYRHNDAAWRRVIPGEADEAAMKAHELIGGYPYRRRRVRKHPPLDEMIRTGLKKWNA